MITTESPVFALGATVNAVPVDLDRAPLPAPAWPLTAGNHFRFGFDTETFAARRSGGARYWTAYGRPARRHEGFVRELTRAVEAIAAAHGPIAIGGNGGPVGLAAAALARRLGADAVIARVEFDDHPEPALPAPLPVLPVRTSFAAFEDFAVDFARRAGCGDAWVALAALAVTRIDRPLLADHGEIRLVNNGVDERLGVPVAPPAVTLVDNEAFTAVDRWMLAQGRGGVAQLLRWSPELIAAQLDSAPYRTWLAATHAPGGAARVAWTNRAARLALWRQGFPEIAFAADSRTACRDARLVIGLKRLSRRMRRAAPGCGSQHHTPLHRLAERLAIAIEPAWLAPARLYGDVARMPLRRAAAGGAP